MKDLPTKLTAKIPKQQRRYESDDDSDEERPESDGYDTSQVDQSVNIDFSSQKERILL